LLVHCCGQKFLRRSYAIVKTYQCS
jgi:hypothetical protein